MSPPERQPPDVGAGSHVPDASLDHVGPDAAAPPERLETDWESSMEGALDSFASEDADPVRSDPPRPAPPAPPRPDIPSPADRARTREREPALGAERELFSDQPSL